MNKRFQPTPPTRTETEINEKKISKTWISTHSAHEDGDGAYGYYPATNGHFNPLRPRGRRRQKVPRFVLYVDFNPLRPRGRRLILPRMMCATCIDFNPLRPRGRRHCPTVIKGVIIYFNPLRPRGRRRWKMEHQNKRQGFQPTPPTRTETAILHKKPTILHHISTIKSHHTLSNHRQPTLHTSKTVLIVQFFRCESPRKFMFASGSHQTI